MSSERRTFSKELKLQILQEVDDGIPMAELSRRYKLSRTTIWKWRESIKNLPDNPFPGKGSRAKSESKKVVEMERLIGRLTMEKNTIRGQVYTFDIYSIHCYATNQETKRQ